MIFCDDFKILNMCIAIDTRSLLLFVKLKCCDSCQHINRAGNSSNMVVMVTVKIRQGEVSIKLWNVRDIVNMVKRNIRIIIVICIFRLGFTSIWFSGII